MFARARYKLAIDGKVIQAGKFDQKSTEKEQEEVLVRLSRETWTVYISNIFYAAFHS